MRAIRAKSLLTVIALCWAAAAAAQDTLVSADGERFRIQHNAHGAILRSADRVVYLGKDCDAYARRHGPGRWHWANGGITVELGDTRIAFPRQEVRMPPGSDCRL